MCQRNLFRTPDSRRISPTTIQQGEIDNKMLGTEYPYVESFISSSRYCLSAYLAGTVLGSGRLRKAPCGRDVQKGVWGGGGIARPKFL